jgi:hypothetical protein
LWPDLRASAASSSRGRRRRDPEAVISSKRIISSKRTRLNKFPKLLAICMGALAEPALQLAGKKVGVHE